MRLKLTATLLLILTLAGLTSAAGSASASEVADKSGSHNPASAAQADYVSRSGCNHDVCIELYSANNNENMVSRVRAKKRLGASAWGHHDLWGGGFARSTGPDGDPAPDHWIFPGSRLYPDGTTFCAEGWWWLDGRWTSVGLPCVTL
jgi:hypothetical protein